MRNIFVRTVISSARMSVPAPFIDYLRVFAVFMVLIVHSCEKLRITTTGDKV